jgi:hypothetical protein
MPREAVRLALDIASRHRLKAKDGGMIVVTDDPWQTVIEVPAQTDCPVTTCAAGAYERLQLDCMGAKPRCSPTY